jgi:hypothetical protein
MNKKQIVMEDNLSIYDENIASYSPAPPLLHNNNIKHLEMKEQKTVIGTWINHIPCSHCLCQTTSELFVL